MDPITSSASNPITTVASKIVQAAKDGATSVANNPAQYNPHHMHEEVVEYGILGLIIAILISVGILIIGLGIYVKYIMDSREAIRRMSISSQYSQSRGKNGEVRTHLPTVPSGVMLLPPDDLEVGRHPLISVI